MAASHKHAPQLRVGDGLTSAERTLRTSVMRALDDIDDETAAAFAARSRRDTGMDRERAIRRIGDVVLRTALEHVDVDMKAREKSA